MLFSKDKTSRLLAYESQAKRQSHSLSFSTVNSQPIVIAELYGRILSARPSRSYRIKEPLIFPNKDGNIKSTTIQLEQAAQTNG
jgi:hypothetical protein